MDTMSSANDDDDRRIKYLRLCDFRFGRLLALGIESDIDELSIVLRDSITGDAITHPVTSQNCLSNLCVYDANSILNILQTNDDHVECPSCGQVITLFSLFYDETLKTIRDEIVASNGVQALTQTIRIIPGDMRRNGRQQITWHIQDQSGIAEIERVPGPLSHFSSISRISQIKLHNVDPSPLENMDP
eukprot:TRINITY_DN7523_c0_g1_i7.p1 TRINITY_DN7523_c0_g1~~TRINITY_DN7523_c0_g1_i7.p1  ORF type:complete len:188 (-),score=30.00 TRINITY_DN7523_c0_g1_i7:209-772(-)